MKSIDSLPDRDAFKRPMYVLAIETPYNIKFLANDCPGCLRAWELRLTRRGWIDLGPNFGLSRIAPIRRMWSTYGRLYDEVFEGKYEGCVPEQIDGYDEEGLLYQHICPWMSGKPFNGPVDMNEMTLDPEEDPWNDDADWWKG
jgi:hypothetical protein